VAGAFVPHHGIIELKCLDGIAVLKLFLYDGVQDNMQERINLAFRIELSISHDVGKFKLIEILLRVLEHDLAESSFFLVQVFQLFIAGASPDAMKILPIQFPKRIKC
jgi:hypothetical protein